MTLAQLLQHKIRDEGHIRLILRDAQKFSTAESDLLHEILQNHPFNPLQAQALADAVARQARFDPNAQHQEEDEDGVSFCAHCLNPPAPPLRDYLMWRQQTPEAT